MEPEREIIYGYDREMEFFVVTVPTRLGPRLIEVQFRLEVGFFDAISDHKVKRGQQKKPLGVNDIRRFIRYHEKRMGIFGERAARARKK